MIAAKEKVAGADLSLARTVWLSSLLAWLLLVLGALALGLREAAGAALGGATILLLFALHLQLARRWLRSGAPAARICLWLLCVLKWPLIGLALFLTIRAQLVAPVWVCVGASVVPAVATATGLRMLRRPDRTEGAR